MGGRVTLATLFTVTRRWYGPHRAGTRRTLGTVNPGAGVTEADTRPLRLLGQSAGWVLVVLGGLVLAGGWLLGVSWLRTFGAPNAPMAPNAAVGVMLLGAGVVLYRPSPRSATVLGLLAGTVGALSLVDHATGALGSGDWLVSRRVETGSAGLPSIPTALCLVGLGLGLLRPRRPRRALAVAVIVVAATTLAVAGLVSYALSLAAEGHLVAGTAMAAPSAAALSLGGHALLAQSPVVRFLGSDGVGGRLARRLALPTAGAFLAVALLVALGHRGGWYGTAEYELALTVSYGTALAWIALYVVGRRLDRVAATAEERDRLLADLRSSHDRLEAQATALRRSNRDLRDFATMAAHDLRQPATSLGLFLQLIERESGASLEGRGPEFLAYATRTSAKLVSLLDDLLAWAGAAGHALEPSELKLRAVAEEAVELLHEQLDSAHAVVDIEGDTALVADESRVLQLLMNLISNGVKYCAEGTRPVVRVGIEADDRGAVITVSDNGLGIEERFFERIFEPFRRLHSEADYPGTGMGLAICQRVAERHGGSISVESQVGVGTTFTVRLPRTPVEPPE